MSQVPQVVPVEKNLPCGDILDFYYRTDVEIEINIEIKIEINMDK